MMMRMLTTSMIGDQYVCRMISYVSPLTSYDEDHDVGDDDRDEDYVGVLDNQHVHNHPSASPATYIIVIAIHQTC